ncbi:MAG: trimeric autotransporter adhesin [Bacteroidota bacterium]|nr:trimeric autotransporter adhesin [Bacteroidota bacterium]
MKNKLQLNAIKNLLFSSISCSKESHKITDSDHFFLIKKIVYIFIALLLCQNSVAQIQHWTGATSTDWNTASNWSPSGVPTSTSELYIFNGTNTITVSGTAIAKSVNIQNSKTLTINTGATLNLIGDGSNFAYLDVYESSTVVNNGTLALETQIGAAVGGFVGIHPTATVINNGTFKINTTANRAIEMGNPNGTNGTATFTNNNCGKLIAKLGQLYVYASPTSIVNNYGFIQIGGNISGNGSFSNYGTVVSGGINIATNNQSGSVIVNNNPTNSTIFSYTGTYLGTINGIYTNTTATTTAGTFTAPNTFVPSGLPLGSQTLYAKITPSGGACSYVVPFTYNYAPPTITAGAVTNAATCGGATGSIAFTTTNVANGTYSLTFNTTGASSPKNINVSSNTFILSGLTAGAYNNFSLTVLGQTATTGTLSPAKTVADAALPNAGLTLSSGTLTATQAGAAYRWFTCPSTLVSGQTARTYTPTASADYKVEVTLNGCVATSNCVSVAVLANDSFEKTNSFVLYPNPSKGIVTIDSQINGDFEITNQLGQKVTQFKVKEGSNTINLESLAEGVYFIKSKNNNFESQKIIIKH